MKIKELIIISITILLIVLNVVYLWVRYIEKKDFVVITENLYGVDN